MEAVDQAMFLLVGRTRKRIDVLLPMVLSFVSGMMHPLLDKIDTVHYTEVSRLLKEGEEYALRCLDLGGYGADEAKDIAGHLVNKYPVHDFVISVEEAAQIGLRASCGKSGLAPIVEQMAPFLRSISAVGVLKEVVQDEGAGSNETGSDSPEETVNEEAIAGEQDSDEQPCGS